ncbi:MAG: hypothetical protein CMH83_01825 [Nocardioides sp.]|nr:hypothetical protein [Nocardioides sp.]
MNPVTSLSLGRIVIGVAAVAKPELVQQRLGADGDRPLITQWFGNREIALGLATLTARGRARTTLVLLGMAVDAADAATAYRAMEADTLPREVGLPAAGVAGGAVLSGLLGLLGVKVGRRKKKQKKAAA